MIMMTVSLDTLIMSLLQNIAIKAFAPYLLKRYCLYNYCYSFYKLNIVKELSSFT